LRYSADVTRVFPWVVTVADHNYDLFSPLEVRFLPANQVTTIDDEKCIFFLKEAGLSIREVMCVMELKKHLKHGQIPFFQRHIHNLYMKMRRKNAKNDVMDLLQFYKITKRNAYDMSFGIFVSVNNHGKTILFGCALL